MKDYTMIAYIIPGE